MSGNCEFKTVSDGLHECTKCGHQVKIRQDPKKIHRACPAMTPTEKVGSFVGAVVDFAKSGFRLSEDEEAQRRLEICGGCEHFDGTSCRLCGCVVAWKAKISSAHCPIQKW